MSTWNIGPVERGISPPMKRAITIYPNPLGSPLVVYVGESVFAQDSVTQEELERIAQKIVAALNEETKP